MSRISCVRSITRVSSAFSRNRCCAGSSSSSTSRLSASDSSKRCFSSSSLPLPTYVRCAGRARCWTISPIGSTPAVRASSLTSASSSAASAPCAEHREDEPALGLRGTWNHRLDYARFDPSPALAERTLALVNIPSESRPEQALYAYVAAARAARAGAVRDGESLVYAKRRGKPLVLLAGHLDTVPAQGNLPGRIEDGCGGRARRERHEGRPRRDDRARPLGRGGRSSRTTSRLLFFPREELGPAENPLPGVFEQRAARRRGRPRHLPRADRQHAPARLSRQSERARRLRRTLGALGAAVARRERDRARVRRAAAPCSTRAARRRDRRPALPRGAVGDAAPRAASPSNVIPARAEATINFRYAPDRTPESSRGADPRARRPRRGDRLELAAGARGARARRSSSSSARPVTSSVEPKQAWTNVADFAARGLDAVNLGPGATRYAHAVDERVEIGELERTFDACSASCSVPSSDARAALPRPRRPRAVPVRPARRLEGRGAARGIELIDFGMGDPRERDPGVHPAGAARLGRRGVVATRARPGCPSCAARSPGGSTGASASTSTRDREIVPTLGSKEAIFSFAQIALGEKRLVAIPEPAYPVYERGALFAGGAVVGVPLREDARLAARPRRVRRLGRDRALLGLLPEQPDRRRRAALVLRGARGAGARARLPALLRRGVLGALVRRAAGLGAAGRRPHERRRLQHAVEALVDDRATAPGSSARRPRSATRCAAFRPTVGTAPQEFVQRASVAAWSDDAARRGRARDSTGASARPLLPALEDAGLRLAGSTATFYLWLDVGGPSEAFAQRLLEHGVVCAPGSFFGPAGEGYVRFALVPTPRPSASARPRSCARSCERRRTRRSPRSTAARSASRSPDGDDWHVNADVQAAILDYFRTAADGAARGRAVRVPRQDPAQARLRGARGARRAAGDRTLRRVPLARRRPDALVREHRRVGRAEHDGRHLGDGRLRRADRRERPPRGRRRDRRRARAARARGR